MARQERRNLRERAALLQALISNVVENPSVTLTVDTLQMWVNLPRDAAARILSRLASSGLMCEIKKGVFVRGTLQPAWR